MTTLKKKINESIEAKNSLLRIEKSINLAIKKIYTKIKSGGKVFLCGNGGSAGDAQHLAAEFLVRLRPNVNRRPIAALSLATDTSTLTACCNDYSFSKVFSRNLMALGKSKDVLIAISTSGRSPNIIQVLKTARKMKILSISFLGNKGGIAKKYSDISLTIDSQDTARIQESHIFLGHYIFESIENKLLKN